MVFKNVSNLAAEAGLIGPAGRPIPEFAHALLTPIEAAHILGVELRTLESWRWRSSDGPPFVRINRRTIRYRKSDLLAWIDARALKSTSDPGPDEAA